ncbi:MAG: hypothetical protein Q8K02_12755 [Flavobacterium sp.]|nr:hypothetical protein [Flavobacterium sp.]
MKTRIVLFVIFNLLILAVIAQNKHGKTTKYPSYKGLIIAGYQGWFRAKRDETNAG